MRSALLLFLFVLPFLLSAQTLGEMGEDYADENVLRYDDYIYKSNIRTVQFHESTWDYSAPIIPLRSSDLLELSFDDLDGDKKQYMVTFVHCNSDWTPSNLMQSEYLNGYFDLNFMTFSYAMGTMQKYTHYTISFPQTGLSFTKSGNYIAYVFANGDRDNLVLSRRFMVFDDKVNIGGTFRQTVGGGQQYEKQQLDFNINPNGYDLTNPYKDLRVVITQNNRWDNAVTDIKPTFINGSQLIYSLNDASSFNGGNEFRYFDMRSLRFLTEKVKEIYRDKDYKNHVVLYPDEIRSTKPYLFYNDINGNYLIRNREAMNNMDIEADYVYVDFFLPYNKPESDGNFYVLGKLTDWRMNRLSKMTYNYTRSGYEAKLYLKQGYYNYIYVLSNDAKKGGDETVTEGNHWDTENDYNVLVYHRKFGQYYDQLIGYKKLNSLKK
jgi:hypothetical protein